VSQPTTHRPSPLAAARRRRARPDLRPGEGAAAWGRERGRRRTVGEGERKAPPPKPGLAREPPPVGERGAAAGQGRGGGGSDRRCTAWAAAAEQPSSTAQPCPAELLPLPSGSMAE